MNNLIKYAPLLLITILAGESRGWTHPETGWQVASGSHMCIFTNYNMYIDNEDAEVDQRDAIGIFYNTQCIGWAYTQSSITIIPAIGNDGNNPQYPLDGDELEFYIYDDSKNQILEIQSLDIFPTWQLNTMPNMNELFACSYNLPIDESGNCIESCNYDLNQNNNVDVLDVILLIDDYLLCNDCNDIDCGDINSDGETNIQDITLLLYIILNF